MNKKNSEGFAVNQLIIPRFDLLSLIYDNEQLSQIKNETSRPTVQIKRKKREPSPIEDLLEPDYAVFESGSGSDSLDPPDIREIQDRLDMLSNKIDSISGMWGSISPSLELVIHRIENFPFSNENARAWWEDQNTPDIINVNDIDDSYRESIIDDLKNYIIGQLGITDLTLDNIEIISIIKGSISINFNIINLDNETLVTIIEGCAASIDDCNNRAPAAAPAAVIASIDPPGSCNLSDISSNLQNNVVFGTTCTETGYVTQGTTCDFDCSSGYIIDASTSQPICDTGGSGAWSANTVACLPTGTPPPPPAAVTPPTTCTCAGGTAATGISCRASGEICSACDAGFGLDGSICMPCPAGSYSAANDNQSCAPHTMCGDQVDGTTRLINESISNAGTCADCLSGPADTAATADCVHPRTCGDINADGTSTPYVCSNDGDYLPKWHGYPEAAIAYSCSGDNCNKDDCCLSQWQWATTALLGGSAVHQTMNCSDRCSQLGLSCDGNAAWFDSTTDAAAFNRAVDAANRAHDPNSNLVNTSGLPNATVTSDADNMQPWCHIDGGCYAHLDDTLSNCDLNMNDHRQWFETTPHPHQLCKCA